MHDHADTNFRVCALTELALVCETVDNMSLTQEKNSSTESAEDFVKCSALACWHALEKLRSQCPLVQCITNYVSMDIMANVLLAAGASPAMAHAEEEVEEFVVIASALLVNMGTLSAPWIKSMHKAAAKARALGKIWVLDPVGAGATHIRSQTAVDLVLSHKPTVIRGNASEIMALAGGICTGLKTDSDKGQKGVDSSQSSKVALPAAKALATECSCVVVVTGKDDYVTDGSRAITVSNGHPVLKLITAAGCALTALLAAFVSLGDPADLNHVMRSCAYALCVFGIAGELATSNPTFKGPGSARMHLLDALNSLNHDTLKTMAKFS